uniref:Uncharacterized protein n=1 Tax=Eutreptiella gymnastica TaxID=73025 RepID=A0A6T1YKL3_9EUGL
MSAKGSLYAAPVISPQHLYPGHTAGPPVRLSDLRDPRAHAPLSPLRPISFFFVVVILLRGPGRPAAAILESWVMWGISVQSGTPTTAASEGGEGWKGGGRGSKNRLFCCYNIFDCPVQF